MQEFNYFELNFYFKINCFLFKLMHFYLCKYLLYIFSFSTASVQVNNYNKEIIVGFSNSA